jgi:UDP-apiose/xylose synthase
MLSALKANGDAPPKVTRILILGAGGFIGSHLTRALQAREGAQLCLVDMDFTRGPSPRAGCTQHRFDIRNTSRVAGLIAEADLVLSLTAVCNPALYCSDPLLTIDANYTDLVPIVRDCARLHKRLIHFSTCEVYGSRGLAADGSPMSAMREDETLLALGPIHETRWTYASAKQLLERYIWAERQTHALDFSIVRPFNVVGPEMDYLPGIDAEGIPRVIPTFISALLRNEPLPLVDGGVHRRSFVAIEDFIDGVLAIIDRPEACRGEIFNLGNPHNALSIRELAQAMERAFRRHVPSAIARFADVSAEAHYGAGYADSIERIPDISKATRLLGWEPRIGLDVALRTLVDHYATRYLAELSHCG